MIYTAIHNESQVPKGTRVVWAHGKMYEGIVLKTRKSRKKSLEILVEWSWQALSGKKNRQDWHHSYELMIKENGIERAVRRMNQA